MKLDLRLYDRVYPKYKNWIDTKLKILYSRIMTYRMYFTMLKKYDTKKEHSKYYIVCSDEVDYESEWFNVIQKNSSVVKFPLRQFWDKIDTTHIDKDDVVEINIEVVETADNAEIYYIDI